MREYTIYFFTDNPEGGLKTAKIKAPCRFDATMLLLVRIACPLVVVGVTDGKDISR